jgi:uncharacterized repeat protein (TIGR03803 family)
MSPDVYEQASLPFFNFIRPFCSCLPFFAGTTRAQTLSILHNFTNTPDGANPRGGLVLSSGVFYGMSEEGGAAGAGTIYSIHADGTFYQVLHSFPALTGSGTNTDGAYPDTALLASGTNLYGTAFLGGSNGNGTVFRMGTNGSNFAVLHHFSALVSNTNADGSEPNTSLALSGNVLYGVTQYGGALGYGGVYAINTDGTGFTNLYSFTGGASAQNPQAGVVVSGNMLYGTTAGGGANGQGLIYRLGTNGQGFVDMYDFLPLTNSENASGAFPEGNLALAGSNLFGLANGGGVSGNGSVYMIQTNGLNFTNLHSFDGSNDGVGPIAGPLVSASTLYGTLYSGGKYLFGTVISVNTNGSGFKTLHSFTAPTGFPATNADGASPVSTLILTNNSLYGLATAGGSGAKGVIFSLSLPSASSPSLGITLAPPTNVVLTWPLSAPGFGLQSTTNLAARTWTSVLTAPVTNNGQFTVTNPVSNAPIFFRLTN